MVPRGVELGSCDRRESRQLESFLCRADFEVQQADWPPRREKSGKGRGNHLPVEMGVLGVLLDPLPCILLVEAAFSHVNRNICGRCSFWGNNGCGRERVR